MSSLGDKIKNVLGVGEHSAEAETGEVERRAPGAFPTEESTGVYGGADQPHVGSKPVPSSGERDLGGTSQDPGLITGPSEHNKLHKKNDPRGHTGSSAYGTNSSKGPTSSTGFGHDHTDSGVGLHETERHTAKDSPLSSSNHPSSHHDGSIATDRHNRPDTSIVPGTGSTTAAGAGGVATRELGGDRSGQKQESGFTSGTTGQSGTTGTDRLHTGSHATSTSGLAAGTGAAAAAGALAGHESHNTVNNGREKSTVSQNQEEPYWGDLPQGAGVYNTVTGHGSGEDTSSQHRNISRTGDAGHVSHTGTYGSTGTSEGSHGPHSSRLANAADPRVDSDHDGSRIPGTTGTSSGNQSYGTGVYNTVTGHGSNREDEQTQLDSNRHREFPLGTTSHSATPDTRQDDHSQRDRHLGESGAALGAGAAAYGAAEHHKHGREAEAQRVDAPNSTATQHSTSGAGLAHRTKDQTAPTTADRSGNTGHSGGLLHRHKDEDDPTTKHTTTTSTTSHRAHENPDDKGHHKEGIVGFLHHKKDDKDVGHSQEPTHSATYDADNTRGIGAGTLSGAAGQGGYNDTTSHSNIPTSQGTHPVGTSTGVGSGTVGQSGYGSTTPHGTHSLERGADVGTGTGAGSEASRLHADNSSHANRTAAGLAGAGAAAGAGYGASRLAQHHNQPDSSSQQYSSLPGDNMTSRAGGVGATQSPTGRDTYNQLPSGTASGVAHHTQSPTSTSTAGIGSRSNDSHLGSGNTGAQGQYNALGDGTPSGVALDSTNTARSQGQPPSSTVPLGSSHGGSQPSTGNTSHGQYNTLSSGTPSGVQVGDTSATHPGVNPSTSSMSDVNQTSSTSGANPTSSTSNASYLPSGNDSTTAGTRRGTNDAKYGAAAGALSTGGAAASASKFGHGSSNVIHPCHKCGAENDISSYFKQ
ncbi:hypothetical protein SCAR479_12797 [Seiridium cardinale]|uniref:Cell surface protein n=1 Tax=Seiridium cardinale TaxID=138064 RepID=A0ABR2X9W8_9PEZI